MLDFLPRELEEYAEKMSSPEPGLLARLNRATHLQQLHPQMLSGHLQGRFLALISTLMQPRHILEIGTYTGYSCICLAEGLAPEGRITTIDINPELESFVRPYLEEAGITDDVDMLIGDAMELIPQIPGEIDLVFLDADKARYPDYYELIMPKLRPGGMLIADNVLWSGKVVDPEVSDADTEGLRTFNQRLRDDDRVETLLLPIRDGLLMVRKH